jgi:hypothetical protein
MAIQKSVDRYFAQKSEILVTLGLMLLTDEYDLE